MPVVLVGYPVKADAIAQYREQHGVNEYGCRPFVQHLESQLGVPTVLARVEDGDEDTNYICCFADYSGRPYSVDELECVAVPAAFRRLRMARSKLYHTHYVSNKFP